MLAPTAEENNIHKVPVAYRRITHVNHLDQGPGFPPPPPGILFSHLTPNCTLTFSLPNMNALLLEITVLTIQMLPILELTSATGGL